MATCDVVRSVVDVDGFVLVVTVDTDKVEVSAPSPSAVDTGSDPDVKTTGVEIIGEKPNANLLLFSFPNMNSQVTYFKLIFLV